MGMLLPFGPPIFPGELSPQPDPLTGQPRPSEAPRAYTATAHTPSDRGPRRPPPVPEGQGPALEWYQETLRTAAFAAVILPAILAVLFIVRDGPGWLTQWYMWVFVMMAALAGFLGTRGTWVAAGATWLQGGRRRKQFVQVYELTEIKVTAGARPYLHLADSAGGKFAMQLAEVQRNPELWALVYNGIRHSVVNGKVNPQDNARRWLALPPRSGL